MHVLVAQAQPEDHESTLAATQLLQPERQIVIRPDCAGLLVCGALRDQQRTCQRVRRCGFAELLEQRCAAAAALACDTAAVDEQVKRTVEVDQACRVALDKGFGGAELETLVAEEEVGEPVETLAIAGAPEEHEIVAGGEDPVVVAQSRAHRRTRACGQRAQWEMHTHNCRAECLLDAQVVHAQPLDRGLPKRVQRADRDGERPKDALEVLRRAGSEQRAITAP